MQRIPLEKWVEANSQSELARLTGFSQGGIRKMLVTGRRIFVLDHGAEIKLEESKILLPREKSGLRGQVAQAC